MGNLYRNLLVGLQEHLASETQAGTGHSLPLLQTSPSPALFFNIEVAKWTVEWKATLCI